MIKNYDIYNVLYYDKIVLHEENKQIIKMYPTPYKIFDTEINEYVLVDEMFAAEKEVNDKIERKETIDINIEVYESRKYKDYLSVISSFIREYINTEIIIDNAQIEVSVAGRTYEIEQAENDIGVKIKQNFIWLDGAESTPGCIKQKTELKDKFHYFYKNKNGEVISEELKKYEEGMVKPYYTQDDEYTYMWLNHFSGGSGTQEDPYLVSTRSDFELIATNLNSHFKQTNDIDFGGSGNPWDPGNAYSAGGHTKYFSGVYDGSNFELKNIYYNNTVLTTAYSFSLFPVISGLGSSIKNVKIKNMNITKNSIQGIQAIASVHNDAILENVRLLDSNFIVLNMSTTNYCSVAMIGSLVASCKVLKCAVINSVFRTEGLRSNDYTLITDAGAAPLCIDLATNKAGINAIEISEFFAINCTMLARYSAGLISSIRTITGNALITKSYILGNQIGRASTLFAGGIFANNYNVLQIRINNFYGSFILTGSTRRTDVAVSGQELAVNTVYYQNLFYDSQKANGTFRYLNATYYQPKTTAQMQQQATYVGFDFATVWEIDSTDELYPLYPDLRNNKRKGIPSIIIPTVIRGFLRVNDITIPYFSFNEFYPPPRIVYRIQDEEALEQYFGLIDEPNTSGLYIAGAQVRTI